MTNKTQFNGIPSQPYNSPSLHDGLQPFRHISASAMSIDEASVQASMQLLLSRPFAQGAPVAVELTAQSTPAVAQPAPAIQPVFAVAQPASAAQSTPVITTAKPNCIDNQPGDPFIPDGCIIQ